MMSEYNIDAIGTKRVYVSPGCRGKGVVSRILSELGKWAN